MNKINGKNVILQRLEGTAVEKSLRFIEGEVRSKIIDLNSEKIFNYQVGKTNTFQFQAKKDSEINKELLNNEVGTVPWISKTMHKKFVRAKEDKQKLVLAEIIKAYEHKANNFYVAFINMRTRGMNHLQDKAENALFHADYLITGMLKDGTTIRFPFVLRSAEVNIDVQNKTVKINKTKEFFPNKPLLFWLGNKENIEVEDDIKNLELLTKENMIEAQLSLYKKLGIDISLDSFDKLKLNTLKFTKDMSANVTSIEDAEYEAKHGIVSLALEIPINELEVNSLDKEKIKFAFSDEHSLEDLLQIIIAPLNSEEIKKILKKDQKFEYGSDLQKTFNLLNQISKDKNLKEEVLLKSFENKEKILKENKAKLALFTELLFEYGALDSDQVSEQWASDEKIEIKVGEYKIKFEKETFFVEKVNMLFYSEALTNDALYKDVKQIFKTKFIEDLFKKDEKRDRGLNFKDFNETEIFWGFKSDYYQRKSIWAASKEKNIVIQGPPGTGKTQTILNIINDNILKGKRTLIVSEKITALDVIYKRLLESSPQYGDFIFDLYNINNGIKFYHNIANVINPYLPGEVKPNPFKKTKNIVKKLSIIHDELNSVYNHENIVCYGIEPDIQQLSKVRDNLDKLNFVKKLDEEEYYKFANWEKELSEWEEYEVSKPSTLTREALIELHKIKETYSEENKNIYYSMALFGKKETTMFEKLRFKKELPVLNYIDSIFNDEEKIEENIKYLNFNPNLYNLEKDKHKLKKFYFWKQFADIGIDKNKFMCIKDWIIISMKIENIDNYIKENSLIETIEYNDVENLNININAAIQKQKFANLIHITKNPEFKERLENIKERKVMHKVVRDFIEEEWSNIKVLFPVVLATPSMVSERLPLDDEKFDSVIIDEASQMLIENAIPTIYRGKQIIISGDKMQLRPAINGQRFSSDLNLSNDIEFVELIKNESILDLYDLITNPINKTMLRTHYRSNTQDLIKFSSDRFYDGKLKFIKQKQKSNHYEPAIEVHDVKGIWFDQKNEVEADKIIKIINKMVDKNEDSIGVILFSKKQARIIVNKLYASGNEKAKKLFESNESKLFIKSIDAVQGEERENIILGIGYGPRVHNYGYISRNYGENRINVAVTRAKNKMIIVKSHKWNEYKITEIPKPGPSALIEYIKYAEENTVIQSQEDILTPEHKIFIEYVKRHYIRIKEEYTINLALGDFLFIEHRNKAYYLIDNKKIGNPREELWFYEFLLKARGYVPMGIYEYRIKDLYARAKPETIDYEITEEEIVE